MRMHKNYLVSDENLHHLRRICPIRFFVGKGDGGGGGSGVCGV